MYIDRFDHFGIQHLMQVDEHYWSDLALQQALNMLKMVEALTVLHLL